MKLTGCLRALYEPKFCKTVRDPTACRASPHDFHRFLDPYNFIDTVEPVAKSCAGLSTAFCPYKARRRSCGARAEPVVGLTGIIRKPFQVEGPLTRPLRAPCMRSFKNPLRPRAAHHGNRKCSHTWLQLFWCSLHGIREVGVLCRRKVSGMN